MDPAPFLRGTIFPGTRDVPYPRAKPGDGRIPGDTWFMATFPIGVRLELVGDARAIEIGYTAKHASPMWPGDGGRSFEAWRHGVRVSAAVAPPGEGSVTLPLGKTSDERTIVYLPERLAPTITSIVGLEGDIEPAPPQPRWICYGDSIAEGWLASEPAYAWPAIVGREEGVNVLNMGYAGAARGELVSAEQISELGADLITISFGTNCWSRTPFDAPLMRETTRAFLDMVRRGHPRTPILVLSMLLRPEGEDAPNLMGATHAALRTALEDAVVDRMAQGDENLALLEGASLIDETMLADNVHPNDDGHRAVASAVVAELRKLAG